MKSFISVYTYGGIAGPCLEAHIKLVNNIAGHQRDANLFLIGEEALISRSRCRATRMFLDSGCDVWLQIDHDIGFDADDAFALCNLAAKHEAAICVPYSCRSMPPRVALRPFSEHPLPAAGTDALTPIRLVAAGFLALPRACVVRTLDACRASNAPLELRVIDCVDDVVHSFPTLWKPLVAERSPGVWEYLSEDYAAGARMEYAGVRQLAWSRPVLQHFGQFPYAMPVR